MERQVLSRLMILSCLVMPATSSLTSPARAQDGSTGEVHINAENGGSSQKPRISIQPLLAFSGDAVLPGGGSILTRSSEGAYMSLHSFGLTPGTAATVWWVFFNNPRRCATSPCSTADFTNPDVEASLVYATGRVVGSDGTADFGAFRAIGDTTGANFGPGLLSYKKAEIHLVVRSHGPAMLDNAELLSQQLSTFSGGCPPNTCANLQKSLHQP